MLVSYSINLCMWPTYIATGIFSAAIDFADGNYAHTSSRLSAIVGAEMTNLIMKRIFFMRESISNAIGVGTSFVAHKINGKLLVPDRKSEQFCDK